MPKFSFIAIVLTAMYGFFWTRSGGRKNASERSKRKLKKTLSSMFFMTLLLMGLETVVMDYMTDLHPLAGRLVFGLSMMQFVVIGAYGFVFFLVLQMDSYTIDALFEEAQSENFANKE